ncbi:MAG: GAF domain-containing protein, partial [Candidatus Eremiobacteraeota bacterium]|nr:GAF domain-containing protein [Candidatus Eremiobacteraeota bacterium]
MNPQLARSEAYRRALEEDGFRGVLVYAALIVILLPPFHYVFGRLPGLPHDSLWLRVGCAAFCASLAFILIGFPKSRRYAHEFQILNLSAALSVLAMLIVDSGEHPVYVASGLLVVIGVQHAFMRVRDVALVFAIGLVVQIGYGLYRGQGADQAFWTAVAIYAAAYLIALVPTMFMIGSRQREILARIEAEAARADSARKLARESVLNRVVESIRTTFDLQQILNNVAQVLGNHVDCDRIFIALWRDDEQCAIVQSEYRRDPASMVTALGTKYSKKRWARLYRRLILAQPIYLADVAEERLSRQQREFFSGVGTKSFVVVPIPDRDRYEPLGFLAASSSERRNAFDDDDLELLRAVTAQIAIAIQQSRVYQQLQYELDYRRDQEQRLHDLANRDPLTGIFNRRYFMTELERWV